MTLDEAVRQLLSLRGSLPEGGEQADQVRALLDELATTDDPEAGLLLVEQLIPLLRAMDEMRNEANLISHCVALVEAAEPGVADDSEDIWDSEDSEDRSEGGYGYGGGGGYGGGYGGGAGYGSVEGGGGSGGDGSDTVSRGDDVIPWTDGSGRRRGETRPAGPTRPGGPPPQPGGPPPQPPTQSGILERTPHIDVDAPLPIAVGSRLTISVYADTQALREGEHGDNLELPALNELTLGVSLRTSPHFSIRGKNQDEIIVRAADPRSTTATFELDCVGVEGGQAGVAAVFTCEWRPAGSVWRDIEVDGAAPVAQNPQAGALSGRVAADLDARPPDLLVTVVPSPGRDERSFDLTFASPHLDAYKAGVTVPWVLPTRTKEMVYGYMKAFTTSDPGGRKAALIGAGRDLFKATPKEFRQAFWQLVDSDKGLKTIYVVTSEPFIPWELMVPYLGARELPPLGVQFSVGRCVDPELQSREQVLPIVDSYVIAPKYRGDKKLVFAAEEEQFVVETFSGEPISPALITTIDAALSARGTTLLHLICHGLDDPDGQILDLDSDERLREVQLSGIAGIVRAVAEKRPFVFINACQVGRAAPSLVGTGGFAARFTALGARCVIAPIWSVKDSVAGQVARMFYERVQAEPTLPFADALRDIRKLAYAGDDPEDSWAAYCFYGDPLAAQAVADR